jgi:hypothetical protein
MRKGRRRRREEEEGKKKKEFKELKQGRTAADETTLTTRPDY